jgi:hypothetical protein
LILEVAERCGLLVILHLEPYEERSPETVREDLHYIYDNYASHKAFHRDPERGNKTLYYVYDSYHIAAHQWRRLLAPDGELTVRGTSLDADFIGLVLSQGEVDQIASGSFDGFYTYFASNAFTQASTWTNWKALAKAAKSNNLMFIPSVGPGSFPQSY